jgi:2'-5' RNA ligase
LTPLIRRQLTLFVDPQEAENIEQIRTAFNPVQHALIKCHVTLCREDEIENIEQVIANLHQLPLAAINIEFGEIIRFDNGKGVLLPAKGNNAAFQTLRQQVLSGLKNNPGKSEPHITLMHPRNSTCTNDIFDQLLKIDLPGKLTFKNIRLIEQKDGGKWETLQNFALKDVV